ncbi:MAG: hypothetical protein QOC87_1220 [Actinomycetota bacterium]|nr:hypothetical protein [Actinomycetota bacterium]
MRVLLWHGYLLSGSGSNVYTANIARSWREAGHDVLVLCQDRHAGDLAFVDGTGSFSADNSMIELSETRSSTARGRCVVARPQIGKILPVYVYDDYEGFEAKRFVDLSDAELESYTRSNVAALVTAIGDFEPDLLVTGHEVMGPFIARQACEATARRYLAKLHGSALEYAVKLQDRYVQFASAGLNGAAVVVGGSRYMVDAAHRVVPGWSSRSAVVNPGCDVDLFKPDPARRNERLRIGYVGKLIASKGVHNLLVALPLIGADPFDVVVVGYGGFAGGLQHLWDAIRTGDRDRVRAIAQKGETGPLDAVTDFVDSGAMTDAYIARAAEIDVSFPGRLEHGPLSHALVDFDVLVAPSVVPEAFGMVAAEAAACGVLPVVPDHSGIAEAGAAVEEAIDHPGLLTFPSADPIAGIAAAVSRVLSLEPEVRASYGARAVELARSRWSWNHVAARLLELAHVQS